MDINITIDNITTTINTDNITSENVYRVAQKKSGNAWIYTYIDNDVTSVYRALSSDLIQKKINACKYIKTIKRLQRYDHVEMIVTYDNNTRSIYYLPAHF